ncbi:HlyD family secretion protein [Rhodopila sp.]|uniref:HlyD family secretion protein n=1 Tax=Rhodopila sp. TaxID=2480087 RepID=UPI003D0EC3C6
MSQTVDDAGRRDDAGGRDDADRGEKSAGAKPNQVKLERGDQLERSPDKARDDNARGDKSRDDDRQSRVAGSDKEGQKPRSRWPLIILAVVVVAAIIAGAVYWFMTRNLESTDDAYTEGNAVADAAKVAGYVTQLNVDDNTFVHKGDLLLKIDPRDYITARDQSRASLSLARAQLSSAQVALDIARVQAPASLQQAQAQLQQAQANKTQAEQAYRRQHAVDPRATTQTDIDQANAQMRSTTASVANAEAQVKVAQLVQQNIQSAEDTVRQRQAQVAQAEASLAQAEVNLSYTDLVAPQDGYITRRNVDLGTFVQAGQQVFYIVTPDVWVTANFKENQLADMHPGQHVSMDVDAYPNLHLQGHIDSIQQGSGARFSTFPAENATGNFVKIVRRVPVKIIIDSGLHSNEVLPLGISVEPTVTVR